MVNLKTNRVSHKGEVVFAIGWGKKVCIESCNRVYDGEVVIFESLHVSISNKLGHGRQNNVTIDVIFVVKALGPAVTVTAACPRINSRNVREILE